MHKAEFYKEFGATAACAIRLAQATFNKGDIVHGDSYFGQVKVLKAIKENGGVFSNFVVKTPMPDFRKIS